MQKNGFCDDVFPFSIEFFQKKKNVWYMCDIEVCVDVYLSILVLALFKKSKVKEIQFIHIFFF